MTPADPRARARADRLLRRAVRAAQPAHRVPGRRAQRQPAQHPRHRPRLQPAPRAASPPPTAWCSPGRCRRTTGSSSSASTPRATCSPTSPATSASRSAARAWRRPTTTSWPAARSSCSSRTLGDLFVDKDRVGDLTLTVRDDLQRIATRAARRSGRARSSRSTRAPARSSPWCRSRRYDPNLLANHDTTEAAIDARTLLDAEPREAAARPRLPGALLPRLDVQGGHRPPPASCTAGSPPTSRSTRSPTATRRPAPPARSATSAAAPAAARCSRSCGCRATPPSPRWASDDRARADGRGVRGLRLQPGRADRPPRRRPGRSSPPTSSRTSRPSPSRRSARTTWPPRRCRWRWWPARSPTTARSWRPTCSRDVRDPDGNVVDTYDPEVWTHGHGRADGRPHARGDVGVVESGTATAPRRPRLRGRRQDRHRPARHRPAAVARVDHRLRRPAGRGSRRSRSP